MSLLLVVQAWLITRTPVSSIDSVRFVSIAQSIESAGLFSVLQSDREQPFFPVVVCGVHRVLDSIGVDPAVAWMRSTQIASVLGLLLAVPAIYLVALRVAGYASALVGTLVFVLLPEVARLGADGIADPWQLALIAWAVVMLGEKRTEGQERWGLVMVGVFMALALLVRVETVVVIGAILVTFAFYTVSGGACACVKNVGGGSCPRVSFFRELHDRDTRLNLALGRVGLFALGLAIVLGPYLLVCGTYRPSQAVGRLLGRAAARETDRAIVNEIFVTTTKKNTPTNVTSLTPSASHSVTRFTDVPGLATFSTKEPGKSIRRHGLVAATIKVAEEVADLFGYWVGLFALLGVWVLRKKPIELLDRFAWIFLGLLLLVMVWFTAKEGYLTARHLLLLLIPGTSCIGIGILTASKYLSHSLPFPSQADIGAPAPISDLAPLKIAIIFAVMMLGIITPHHTPRSAYREAGRWLAAQRRHERTSLGSVFDTRGWTSLFSTMPTYQAEQAKNAFADPRLKYIVVMEEELLSESDRSHTLRKLLDRGAKRVAQFTSVAGKRSAESLLVYQVQPQNYAYPKPHLCDSRYEKRKGSCP